MADSVQWNRVLEQAKSQRANSSLPGLPLDTRTLDSLALGLQRSLHLLLNSPAFSLGLGITPGFPGSEAFRLGLDRTAA